MFKEMINDRLDFWQTRPDFDTKALIYLHQRQRLLNAALMLNANSTACT